MHEAQSLGQRLVGAQAGCWGLAGPVVLAPRRLHCHLHLPCTHLRRHLVARTFAPAFTLRVCALKGARPPHTHGGHGRAYGARPRAARAAATAEGRGAAVRRRAAGAAPCRPDLATRDAARRDKVRWALRGGWHPWAAGPCPRRSHAPPGRGPSSPKVPLGERAHLQGVPPPPVRHRGPPLFAWHSWTSVLDICTTGGGE